MTMLDEFFSAWSATIHLPALWVAVGQIIAIDIVLAGDNAVVIAMACRLLDKRQRFWGMVFGALAAVLLRIAFTLLVTQTMHFAYVKLAGGLLLLWIGIKLVVPDEPEPDGHEKVRAADNLIRAIGIIAVADIAMSLDNVIAIAAMASSAAAAIDAAHAPMVRSALIAFGLIVSIPLVVAGSAIVLRLLERAPILIWAGAALLGWIAGGLIASDVAIAPVLARIGWPHLALVLAIAGAVFVVLTGWLIRASRTQTRV